MGVGEPCASCDGKCCGMFLITVTAYDIARIFERVGGAPADFLSLKRTDEASFALEQPVFLSDGRGGVHEYLVCLGKGEGRFCMFHTEDGRCAIHPFAPLACRAYPFVSEGSNGELKYVERLACRRKWTASEKKESGAGEALDRLKTELRKNAVIVRKWNAEHGRRGGFFDFLKYAIAESKKEHAHGHVAKISSRAR